MMDLDHDRRRAHRVSLTRPCKAYDPRSRKYFAGTMRNVSEGGMLLHIDRPVDLDEGDILYIGVPHKRRQALLASAEMLEARVVRTAPALSGQTAIGVRFSDGAQDEYLPLRLAA